MRLISVVLESIPPSRANWATMEKDCTNPESGRACNELFLAECIRLHRIPIVAEPDPTLVQAARRNDASA